MTIPADSVMWLISTHTEYPNGSAHRLLHSLSALGRDAALIGVPLAGGAHWRLEAQSPTSGTEYIKEAARSVPMVEELLAPLRLMRLAGVVFKSVPHQVVSVACDPISYCEARIAARLSGMPLAAQALWMVDWSPERLRGGLSAYLYRSALEFATRDAQVVAAISDEARRQLESFAKGKPIELLPNPPLIARTLGSGGRVERCVAYAGTLSYAHGTLLILEAARILAAEGVTFEIAGSGPALGEVKRAAMSYTNIHYRGVISDPDELVTLLFRATVGLALYDPSVAQFSYGDSLKTMDYLAAGLHVLSTQPRAIQGSGIRKIEFSTEALVAGIRDALAGPSDRKSVRLAEQSSETSSLLRSFVAQLETLGGGPRRASAVTTGPASGSPRPRVRGQ